MFLTLAANLFVPWGLATSLSPAALAIAFVTTVAKLVVLAVLLAIVETRVAKLRLFRVPELLAVSFVLGLLAVTSSFSLSASSRHSGPESLSTAGAGATPSALSPEGEHQQPTRRLEGLR